MSGHDVPESVAAPEGRSIRLLVLSLVVLILGAIGVILMTYGSTNSMPDNLHTTYGFPLVWGSHLTNSIIGPVDRWTVDMANMTLDLVFWLGVTVFGVVAAGTLARGRFKRRIPHV